MTDDRDPFARRGSRHERGCVMADAEVIGFPTGEPVELFERDGWQSIGEAAADAAILGLFRRWILQHRNLERLGDRLGEEGVDEKLIGRLSDILTDLELEIAGSPVAGPVGLAIKAYMVVYYDNGGSADDAPALSAIWSKRDLERHVDARMGYSLLQQLAQFVPDIAPLTTRVVGEPDTA